MSENLARLLVTLTILVGNLIVFVTVVALWLAGGFSTGEFKQTVLLLTPLLFAYCTPIVRDTLVSRHDPPLPRNISAPAFWVTVAVPPIVQLLAMTFLVMKAYNVGFPGFDDFTVALGTTQTVFGAYVGLVITTYFPGGAPAERVREE